MARPLVIGVGEAGVAGLPSGLCDRLAGMDLVIAAPRFHDGLPAGPEIIDWPSPFSGIFHVLKDNASRSVALLTTGDPMWFGAGASLVRELGPEGCEVIPAVSGLQLAAARLGWPMAGCRVVSVHGRPVSDLASALHPRARLLVIARDGSSPMAVARLLAARGYGAAKLHVLSHLGGPEEARIEGTAEGWHQDTVADFHIIGVECPDAGPVPHGLAAPDSSFDNDGKLTKRDVRASALAKLAPFPAAILWDIGSGSGAVAVDFLRNAPRGKAYAIDRNQAQLDRGIANAEAHGVSAFIPVSGDAGEQMPALERPDAVFIGGGISEQVILTAQAALRPGGCLVAHAVTIESESVMIAAWQRSGGDLARLSVQHADPVGGFHGWRPLMPVTQWCWHKQE
ncbi:MAG: precorrin-6y C5,15-methyltransferase (decarboxylating) subunit CbiE [Pseudomonadota bacterium]|nr:precorrin-6y C5,15-methyltransferase (decarboxylating) subunit CbiE [Pseudomonadota bacterium]